VIPGITAWCPNYHKCIMIHFRYHGDTSKTTPITFLVVMGAKIWYHDTDFFLIRMALYRSNYCMATSFSVELKNSRRLSNLLT
jgi:hypothetical protein